MSPKVPSFIPSGGVDVTNFPISSFEFEICFVHINWGVDVTNSPISSFEFEIKKRKGNISALEKSFQGITRPIGCTFCSNVLFGGFAVSLSEKPTFYRSLYLWRKQSVVGIQASGI